MADYNTNIQAGPVMSELPTLYSPNQDVGRETPRFDSSGFAGEAFQRLPLDVALKAMEGAVQLEGTLGYAADIKAGVPDNVALAHWAPKLWYRHPAQIHAMMQANKPAFTPSKLNIEGQEMFMMSPNRATFAPKAARTDLSPSEQIHTITSELAGLKTELDNADPKEEPILRKRHRELLDSLSALRTKHGVTPDTVRVRDKKTGKILRYPAHRKQELPVADYEILGQ